VGEEEMAANDTVADDTAVDEEETAVDDGETAAGDGEWRTGRNNGVAELADDVERRSTGS
jgi:hypothetical protein